MNIEEQKKVLGVKYVKRLSQKTNNIYICLVITLLLPNGKTFDNVIFLNSGNGKDMYENFLQPIDETKQITNSFSSSRS